LFPSFFPSDFVHKPKCWSLVEMIIRFKYYLILSSCWKMDDMGY
jgi:hypothetical protein